MLLKLIKLVMTVITLVPPCLVLTLSFPLLNLPVGVVDAGEDAETEVSSAENC